MKDASLPLNNAIADAIVSRLDTEGYSSPSDRVIVDPEPDTALPYVVIGQGTGIPYRTKSHDGGEYTHTFTAWATTFTEASQIADYAQQAVTDRSAPLSVTGFDCALAIQDFRGGPIREKAPGTASSWYWGVPIRIRYRLIEQ